MTPTVSAALLERQVELEVLRRATATAGTGRGAVVLVEGSAGIGKTSLLEATRKDAERAGFRVLAARAGPLERGYAFAVVRELVEPAVRGTPRDGAARLADPVLDPVGAGAPTFATLHGIYWLLADLTEQRPLLLAVDDAHWADTASLQALAHLARRIADLPLLIVLTARPADSGAATELFDTLRAEPGTTVLRPGPLSAAATAALASDVLGGPVDARFGRACHKVTEGNPLLLGTLLRSLRDAGITPTAEGIAAVRARAPAIVAAFVLALLRQLPAPAVAVARALAVLGPGAPLRHVAAIAGLEPVAAAEVIDRLVAAELVVPAPLGFVHPLFGQAVADHMTTAQRHTAHRAAARELAADGVPAEAVAAHLLHVEPLRDPEVVAHLRRAARAALAKGAARAAVAHLERALAEPPPAEQRVDVLFELGAAQTRLAPGSGTPRLREALEIAVDPARRDRIALELAESLELVSDLERAVIVLERAVGEIEQRGPGDPDAALRLETELVALTRANPATQAAAVQRLERLRPRARPDTAPGCVLLAAHASELLQDPTRTTEAVAAAEQALAGAGVTDPGRLLVGVLYTAGWVLVCAAELDRAAAAADRAVESARGRGTPVELGAVLHFRADVALGRGAVLDAEADARLAQDLAAQVDLRAAPRRQLLGDLLDALVERGRPDEAERELTAMGGPGADDSRSQLLAALGRLRLAQGRPAEALDHALGCGARLERRGWRHPGLFTWQTDAALAAHRLGDAERARCLADAALEAARRFDARVALGVALRTAGLLTDDVELLDEAVAVLAPSAARLEHARALVELGACLRRGNRRTAAREPLRDGLDLAARCGATALADRTVDELAAAGARPRRRLRTGVEALSPSERRVARLAAQGLSNRDIAQALFVTTKTVEVHLSACYRKLAISSRAELPALFPG
jgi:DNA-binding CsgD family transcriptional regulator